MEKTHEKFKTRLMKPCDSICWGQDFPCTKEFHINELESFAVILAAKH
jgi:hypothetical protein